MCLAYTQTHEVITQSVSVPDETGPKTTVSSFGILSSYNEHNRT